MAATTSTDDEPGKEAAPTSARYRTRAHSERAAETTAETGDETTRGVSAAGSTAVERAAEPTVETSAAGSTVVERVAEAVAAPDEAGFAALRTMSRMIYVTSYAIAYGIVYAAVFAANSLPQDNPVIRGFRDGAQAAIDELSKAEQVAGSEPVSEAAAAQPA